MTRNRRWIIPAVALGLLALGPAPAALSTHGATDVLPDLETQRPKDIEIVTARVGNRTERRLRFDNAVANLGPGPLELYPESRDCNGDGDVRNDRLAVQRIYRDSTDEGSPGYFVRGVDRDSRVHETGCMDFHAAHRHWHFEDFASYELKSLGADGSLGDVVASSTKVSFCIIDVNHPRPNLPGSPSSKYYTQCGRNDTLGVSVGWSDEYHSTLADQYVVLPPIVDDGAYCLVSTADPTKKLLEVTTSNNTASARITISGGGTRVVERDPTQSCG